MDIKSYFSPKTEIKKSPIHGKGLFGVKPIKKDEIIGVKCGHVVDKKTLKELNVYSELQITDDLFVTSLCKKEDEKFMMFVNHSCDPNMGVEGNVVWVAMRNIKAGEEITVDYATFNAAGFYKIKCNCKTKNCRKLIKGNDWKIPELQKKYKNYFSAFLQKKIDKIRK